MALIKCNECGKKISDKAKTCIHCRCPIIKIENKEYVAYKSKNNYKEEKQKSKGKLWIFIIVLIYFFLIMRKLLFNNISALIFTIIYFSIFVLLYNYIKDNIKNIQRKKTIVIMCSIFVPFIISIQLVLTNTEWNYYIISTDYNTDTEFYHLNTNIFGKCRYSYHNLNKDIEKESSACKYEKNNNIYTFYLTEKGTNEKSSFECQLTNGKLKCPLQYTYPTEYISFQKK